MIRKMPVAATVVVVVTVAIAAAAAYVAFIGPGRQADRFELSQTVLGVWTDRSYAYVVEGPAGVVLIDAGSDPKARELRRALASRGRHPNDVVAVLITHGHRDQWAGLAQFPRATAYVGAEDHRMVRGDKLPQALLPRLYARLHDNPPRHPNIRDVLPGALLQLAGLEFEVIAVPGHTNGSMMYRQGSTLFVGDGLWLDGADITMAGCLHSRSTSSARRSLRRLRDVSFGSMCDARVGCAADGKPRVERWLSANALMTLR